MALQDHARLTIFVNGSRLVTPNSININWDSGQQTVITLEGLSGFTPTGGTCTVEVSQAVPIGGLEMDFTEHIENGSYIELQVPIGAKSYIGNGKILNGGASQSAQASTEGTWSWQGELKKLQ